MPSCLIRTIEIPHRHPHFPPHPHRHSRSCGAVGNILYNHHYTNTPDATVRAAIQDGGTDVDCGTFYLDNMVHVRINVNCELQVRRRLSLIAHPPIANVILPCDNLFPHYLHVLQAVANGNVTQSAVSTAARNFLRQVIRLGAMDPPERNPYSKLGPADVDTPANR